MKKKSFLKIGGAMLLLAIVLNIRYAWGDYGIKDHPLHLEVLAQSNDTISTGGDGDKGTGTGTLWFKTTGGCSIEVRGEANSEITIFGAKVKVGAKGVGSLTMTEASTRCENGGKEQCSSMDCGEFWIKMAQAHGTPAK